MKRRATPRAVATGPAGAATVVATALLLLSPPPSLAQDTTHPRDMNLPATGFARPDPERFRVELDNGLVVYVVEDHTVPLVSFSAFASVGTAHGPEGAAEVLLRGLQQGPAGVGAGDFRRTLEAMVAEYQVAMGAEETEITLNVPAEDAVAALRLLAGVLQTPNLPDLPTLARGPASAAGDNRSDAAAGESGPILYEGSLDATVGAFHDRLFDGHPYGYQPTADDFAALNRQTVAEFGAAYLSPDNVTLAIAGDFAATEMREVLIAAFGSWSARPAPEPTSFAPVATEAPRRLYLHDVDKLQGWVVLGHELPLVPVEEQAALEVMNYILGGGHFDTRLFRVTRDRRGLTNDDSGFLEPSLHGPGAYTFRTYGRPAVIRLLIELTLREIERIRGALVTEEELFVAQGALVDGAFAAGFADGNATARTLALEWLRDGNHGRSAAYADRVRAVTREQVRAAAQKYLHPERMTIVVIGPIDEIRAAPPIENERRLDDYGRSGSTPRSQTGAAAPAQTAAAASPETGRLGNQQRSPKTPPTSTTSGSTAILEEMRRDRGSR